MSSLSSYLKNRQDSIIQLIKELFEQESTSREEARLNGLARSVAAHLQGLDGELELIPVAGYGTHLRARFNLGHDPTVAPLLVIGHLDTVWPVGTLARLPFRVTDEGRAHG